MKVELIAYSQPVGEKIDKNPLGVVEQAACVCYGSKPSDSYKVAKGCKASKHFSPLEHVSFTFHISGVSRALLAQLSRHRHISLSVASQRYISQASFDYVNPFEPGSCAAEYFSDTMAQSAEDYKTFLWLYNAEKEDARAVLPNACCTEMYMTANARALIEIGHLRLCNRAQREIRELFQEIKKEVFKVAPEIAGWMVPSCEANPKYPFCTEHNSCGRHPKLSEVYKDV